MSKKANDQDPTLQVQEEVPPEYSAPPYPPAQKTQVPPTSSSGVGVSSHASIISPGYSYEYQFDYGKKGVLSKVHVEYPPNSGPSVPSNQAIRFNNQPRTTVPAQTCFCCCCECTDEGA